MPEQQLFTPTELYNLFRRDFEEPVTKLTGLGLALTTAGIFQWPKVRTSFGAKTLYVVRDKDRAKPADFPALAKHWVKCQEAKAKVAAAEKARAGGDWKKGSY